MTTDTLPATPPPAPAPADDLLPGVVLAWEDAPPAPAADVAGAYAPLIGLPVPMGNAAADVLAAGLLADAVDLIGDADDLSAALEAEDYTAFQARDVLCDECPGLNVSLSESATAVAWGGECHGVRVLTARTGVGFFVGPTWRAVVADALAAYRAGGKAGGE